MRVLESNVADKQDVRHLSDVQMARLGIRVVNMENLILQCVTCGETWSPELDSNGKLGFEYWLCPSKCNR